MIINVNSKYCQFDTDNIDDNSLNLSFRRDEPENEKYYQNINISLYGCDDDYG